MLQRAWPLNEGRLWLCRAVKRQNIFEKARLFHTLFILFHSVQRSWVQHINSCLVNPNSTQPFIHPLHPWFQHLYPLPYEHIYMLGKDLSITLCQIPKKGYVHLEVSSVFFQDFQCNMATWHTIDQPQFELVKEIHLKQDQGNTKVDINVKMHEKALDSWCGWHIIIVFSAPSRRS